MVAGFSVRVIALTCTRTMAVSPALRRYTENAIARIRVSAEGQEGLNAFLNKRPPAWQEPH